VQIETRQVDGYETVVHGSDPGSGLDAYIAVHDTTLGPALGGCRMWPYADADEALEDVLRLSRGMTFKAAVARLPLGGGKAVIVGDPRRDKSEALLEAFGSLVDHLGGRYVTGEDVGIGVEDVARIARRTRHAVGRAGQSGDPSPITAWGVFMGLSAAVRHKLRTSALSGLTVGVQGLGHVGYHLCRYLHRAGANLVVTDTDETAVARVVAQFGATPVDPEGIYGAECEVFAPCALGGAINADTLPRIKAVIVAGAANNQLAAPELGTELARRGILYAPDYVINSGGLINIAEEVVTPGDYDKERVMSRVEGIATTLARIFREADREGVATNVVADRIALGRLETARAA